MSNAMKMLLFDKYWFGSRTTKLLSQKRRRHLAIFCIRFLWRGGPIQEKRRDHYLKKKPSSGILHQSNCSRIRLNNENSKFKREFITILIPLWQAAVQACGGWHVCLGTFLLWPKLLCQLWAPFSPILCALWGESKSLECLFQQSEAENIPAAFDIILPHDAGRYKLDQARVGARACAHKRVGVGHLACGYPRAGLQSACASRAGRGIVRKGWAQLLLQLKFTSIIPKGDRCAYI